MTIVTGERTMPITFAMKSGLTRVDVQTGEHTVSMIMDPAKQEITAILPQQHMAVVQPMQGMVQAAENKVGDVTLEKTDTHEKILGYDTTKYIAKTSDGTSEIWVTDQLGTFAGLGSGGSPMGFGGHRAPSHPAGQAWEEAFKGKQAFPLRVVTTGSDGKQVSKLEVTAIDKKSLPDSEFEAPADYRKMDMRAMMQGMGMPGGMHMPMRGNNR